jgi:hypothetical protein
MENLFSGGFNGKPAFRTFQWKTCFQEVSMENLFSGGFNGKPVFRRFQWKTCFQEDWDKEYLLYKRYM